VTVESLPFSEDIFFAIQRVLKAKILEKWFEVIILDRVEGYLQMKALKKELIEQKVEGLDRKGS